MNAMNMMMMRSNLEEGERKRRRRSFEAEDARLLTTLWPRAKALDIQRGGDGDGGDPALDAPRPVHDLDASAAYVRALRQDEARPVGGGDGGGRGGEGRRGRSAATKHGGGLRKGTVGVRASERG